MQLIHGDCLEKMKDIPDRSVDCVITDPPYFKVKSHYWDNEWKSRGLFLSWLGSVFTEIKRIIKDNGSIYVFCYPTIAFEVELELRKTFNVLNHIVWEKYNDPGFEGWKQKTSKESLRKYYPNSERILFAERKSFGEKLKTERIKHGYSTIQLAEMVGAFGKTNHGGSVSNWENDLNIPTEEQYIKLQSLLNLPDRSSVIRPFCCRADIQYTDVLRFKTVKPYSGKHPCEKPLELIEHLIRMSSNDGQFIFDPFMGSGSTGIACINTNRNFIGIEKDDRYFEIAKKRIEEHRTTAST